MELYSVTALAVLFGLLAIRERRARMTERQFYQEAVRILRDAVAEERK